MTTRPTHDTTPEDASLSRWMIDVEQFIDELIGSELVPSAPADLTLESDKNSVKIKFRAVNEVGVSEYQIFRSSEKNFSSAQSELIATVPQAVDPATTTIVFSDAEAVDKKFYFVRAVKGRRIPKIVGPVIGFGSAISGEQLGEGEGILGVTGGTPGSILFINDDQNIDEDNENLFWDQQRKRVVLGPDVDLSWGAVHRSPDLILTREGADILSQVREGNAQSFRVYEKAAVTASPITSNLLLAEIDTTDLTVYTTSPISPGANNLVLCAVQAADLGFVGPITVSSVTGAGLTWVKVAEVQFNTIAGPRLTHAVFRALGPTPSPGALTVTMDGPAAEASFVVTEYGGVDTGGINGSAAVVQFATNVTDSGTSITATLAAFASLDNATYGSFAFGGGPATWTPGSGFIELAETPGPPGTLNTMAQFRTDNDTTVDASHSGAADDLSVIAIEIKNASASAGRTFLELKALGASGGFEAMVEDDSGDDRPLTVGTRDPGILNLATDNVARWRVLVNGNFEPLTDALYDIAAPGSQVRDLYLGESFIQSDPVHSHVIGGALLDHVQFRQTGLFTSGGGDVFATLNLMDGALTGADGDTDFLSGTTLRSSINTQGNSEAILTASQLRLEEPNILLGAGDNILEATTLHVVGPPTEGDENFSILVSAGLSKLQDLDLEGDLDLLDEDLGNDIPGRIGRYGRNENTGPEGGAPGAVELVSADGTSCFIWCKNDGSLAIGSERPTGSTGSPTVPSEIGGVVVSTPSIKSYSFESPPGGPGTFFVAGFYDFDVDDANLSNGPPPTNEFVTHGNADHPYGGHAAIVAGGPGTASGGAGTVEIEVSGTSIDSFGVRTASDTEILVADVTTMALNDYFQTTKRWIGPVTFTLQNSTGSTHTTFTADFNFGIARVEDFGLNNFNVNIFDFAGIPGANDSVFNVELLHHNSTGWTYAATGFVPGNTPLLDFAADYGTESNLDNTVPFSYQRIDVDTLILGASGEGIIIRITTGANNTIKTMDIHMAGLFT